MHYKYFVIDQENNRIKSFIYFILIKFTILRTFKLTFECVDVVPIALINNRIH